MECLDDDVILAAAEGRRALGPNEQQHLATCEICRQVLAAAARGAGEARMNASPPPPQGEPGWDELGAGVLIGGGAYVLDRFLGAGGMGVVWAGRRCADGYPVALKVARSGDLELTRRFEREARVASALAHPNVVRVFDVLPATHERGPCIVQELVPGETLEQRLAAERRLSLQRAARLVLPVASALEAAHGKGIVHRDIKPSNVLVSSAGPSPRVVVVDFGVAKLLPTWGDHSKLTRSGTVVGTPRYMAPEQVFGEPDVDARADVWALGALLFRMLTGRDAVEADGVGAMVRTFREREMAKVVVDIPSGLPENVAWLLASALTIARPTRLADVRPFLAVMSVHAKGS